MWVDQMPIVIFIVGCLVLAFLDLGKWISFLFIAILIGGIGFTALQEKEGVGFFKIFILPIIVIMAIGAFFTQCDGNRTSSDRSNGSWFKSNPCLEGAEFDNFGDGRGQWRNKDGKFCSQ